MGSMPPVPADKVAVTTQTDYCCNVIYENGALRDVLSKAFKDDGAQDAQIETIVETFNKLNTGNTISFHRSSGDADTFTLTFK